MKTLTINLLIAVLTVAMFAGCSSINKLLNETQLLIISGVVENVVYFDFGPFFKKAYIVFVKFENKDAICFVSYKEASIFIGEKNTILYIKLPETIPLTGIAGCGSG